jgi:hypothetical protein
MNCVTLLFDAYTSGDVTHRVSLYGIGHRGDRLCGFVCLKSLLGFCLNFRQRFQEVKLNFDVICGESEILTLKFSIVVNEVLTSFLRIRNEEVEVEWFDYFC